MDCGLRDEEIPKLRQALSKRWLTIIPFLSIIYMIFSGSTPYWAAFWQLAQPWQWALLSHLSGGAARTKLNINEENC